MTSTVLIGTFTNCKAVAKAAVELAEDHIDLVMAGFNGKFGIDGCYECKDSSCRKGMFKEKIKPLAFTEFVRRYGKDELLECLEKNEKNGVVYHRQGIIGDYDDFNNIEDLILFIKTGKK